MKNRHIFLKNICIIHKKMYIFLEPYHDTIRPYLDLNIHFENFGNEFESFPTTKWVWNPTNILKKKMYIFTKIRKKNLG